MVAASCCGQLHARLSTRPRRSQLPPTRPALAALVPEHLVARRRSEQTAFLSAHAKEGVMLKMAVPEGEQGCTGDEPRPRWSGRPVQRS